MQAVMQLFSEQTGPEKEVRLYSAFEQLNAELKQDMLRRKRHLAGNQKFNAFVVVMILLNTIIIGLEVDGARGTSIEDRMVYFGAEFGFAIVFFCEFLVRLNQLKWDYFVDLWNVFDYALVVLSLSDVVATLMDSGGGMGLASSLRIFRLLRVVRSIRGVRYVAGLWLIIQGLLDSFRTVVWIGCAVAVFLFCFSVALVTSVGFEINVRLEWPHADIYVGSVMKGMMTVLQVVTFDAWTADIVRPLLRVGSLEVSGPVILGAIVVLSFGTLNILVAVMVERISTIASVTKENSQKIMEKTEAAVLQAIVEEFHEHDKDESGDLELKEFKKLIRLPSLSHKLGLLGIHCDEAENLFAIMDVDHSGTVTPEEFAAGLQKVKGSAKGTDVLQLIGFSQRQCVRATRFVQRLRALNHKADEIQERCNSLGGRLQIEVVDKQEASKRNDATWKKAAARQLVVHKLDRERMKNFPDMLTTFTETDD
eukprot:gb/GFBE01057293.1/.p1 GENE.gb/GFBE01057293.1/~~gb/GFBE01057293.1/.p1  ORF type:complete len:480 (+),score=115.09 gb/GFBE01057293.1/:1-1440(+)